MEKISVKLPDGALVELPKGSSIHDLAQHISPSLAKQVVVAHVNGQTSDLRDELTDGVSVKLFKADSHEGLDTLRHSCEHILAAAVCNLFKGAQVTMGPKEHGEGFYYDFDIGRPFTPEDLASIENEMALLISQKVPFSRSIVSKDEAKQMFEKLGQRYKPEILDWIPGNSVSVYQCADFIDLCRGPHVPHAGFIGAFKLMANSGTYWRADKNREMLQRISGIAFAAKKDLDSYLFKIEEAKKRDHRKLGKALELFYVSEKFDPHEYPHDQPAELLITGNARPDVLRSIQFNMLFAKEFYSELEAVFVDNGLKMSGISVAPQAQGMEGAWDIELKLYSSNVHAAQRAILEKLVEQFNKKHPEGAVRLSIEPHFHEELGPGLVTWLPKGGRLRVTIEDLSRKMHLKSGYEIVYTPHIAKSDLWKVSGHWGFYRESMFSPIVVDGNEYMLKPMNCPFHVLIYKHRLRSYRELPLRLAEFGTVYRYELAGVMHGLMRVRGFTQDDAHLFCRWDQVDVEIDNVIGFILKLLKMFEFSKFEVKLSTRPEKYVGRLEDWSRAEQSLKDAVVRHGLDYEVDEGGGAFYGPKIDIKLKDSLDRLWQCSTVQLDFNLPERFGLSFVNSEGKPERPVMIHRALFGSIERFMGVLIEEFAGAFPFWLAPEQIRILCIADRHMEYAKELESLLLSHDFRVTTHGNSDKLGAKIRQAQIEKIPIMLVIGDKEASERGASVRVREGDDVGFKAETDLVTYLKTLATV